jgi:hypothetical protein
MGTTSNSATRTRSAATRSGYRQFGPQAVGPHSFTFEWLATDAVKKVKRRGLGIAPQPAFASQCVASLRRWRSLGHGLGRSHEYDQPHGRLLPIVADLPVDTARDVGGIAGGHGDLLTAGDLLVR